MKKTITLFACIYLLMARPATAAPTDSLILNDGKVLTGTVEKKSKEQLNNTQLSLDNTFTLLDEGGGKPEKVQNKNVAYFIIDGIRYASKPMVGGHKFMRVLVEGKASLYNWAGAAYVAGTRTDNFSHPGYSVQTTTVNEHDIAAKVLFINDKSYTPNAKWLKKQFSTLFGDCPKLVEKAKDANFNFNDLEAIVIEYNECLGGTPASHSNSNPGSH